MTLTKEAIKNWLKKSNRERDWLAEQLGVASKTVDNWLSSPQNIPHSKLLLIQRLMEDSAAEEEQRKQQLQPTNQIFSLEVDLPRFRAYNEASLAAGLTLEQWAIQCCDEEAKLTEEGAEQRNNLAIIADEPLHYGKEKSA